MDNVKPWISDWFLKYYQKHFDGVTIDEYKLCKPKKVQIVDVSSSFRDELRSDEQRCLNTSARSGVDPEAGVSWLAVASDKEFKIPLYFTHEAIQNFESSSDGLRFTQLSGSILQLLEWSGSVGTINTSFALGDSTKGNKGSIYLKVSSFVYKGCIGEPVFGDPRDIMTVSLFADFVNNELRKSSSGNSAAAISRKSSIFGRKSSKAAPLSRQATVNEVEERGLSEHASIPPDVEEQPKEVKTSSRASESSPCTLEKTASSSRLVRHPNELIFRHSQWPLVSPSHVQHQTQPLTDVQWEKIDQERCWLSEDEEAFFFREKMFRPRPSQNDEQPTCARQIGYENYFSSPPINMSNSDSQMHVLDTVEHNCSQSGTQRLARRLEVEPQAASQQGVCSQGEQLSQTQWGQRSQPSQQSHHNHSLSTDKIDSSLPLPAESQLRYIQNRVYVPQSLEICHDYAVGEGEMAISSSYLSEPQGLDIEECHVKRPISPSTTSNVNNPQMHENDTRADPGIEEDSDNPAVDSPTRNSSCRVLRPAPLLLKRKAVENVDKIPRRIDVVNKQLQNSNKSVSSSQHVLESIASLEPHSSFSDPLLSAPLPSPQMQSPQRAWQSAHLSQDMPLSSPGYEEEDSGLKVRKPGEGVKIQKKRKGFENSTGNGLGQDYHSKKQLDISPADLEREEDYTYDGSDDEIVSTPSFSMQYIGPSGAVSNNTPPAKNFKTSDILSAPISKTVARSSRIVRRRILSTEDAPDKRAVIPSSTKDMALVEDNDVHAPDLPYNQSQPDASSQPIISGAQPQVVSQPQLESQCSFKLSQSECPVIETRSNAEDEIFKSTQEVADVSNVPDSQEALDVMQIDSQQLDNSLHAYSRTQQSLSTPHDSSQINTSNSNSNSSSIYPHLQKESQTNPITSEQVDEQTRDIIYDFYDDLQSQQPYTSPPAGQHGQRSVKEVLYVDPIPPFKHSRMALDAIKSLNKM
ncbi:hypothetical protein E3P99_00879 [Wallemia hederae]|uniref:Telomere replication protein EST3 n=1 Tax=Wallemia hederae TaxID=1540922 RepID=A0A4T0FT02_9BASI|nr:hypothetical protein E3P99_00879 [Wallemia hederae]